VGKFTFRNVLDNMLCAVEMDDPKPTKRQLLGLAGPTKEQNERALEQLKRTGAIFEEEGHYYIAPSGLNRFLELTGGIRLPSGPEGNARIERS